MKKLFARIDSGLYFLENGIIILTLGIMVILSFLQVLLRNFFETGLLWADIFLRHLVLWVGFAGASLATRQDKHISIDLLTKVVPARFLLPVKITLDIFAIVMCFILAKASYVFLTFEKEAGTIVFENIPTWYLQVILPAGFGLIGFRFFMKSLQRMWEWRATKNQGKSKP